MFWHRVRHGVLRSCILRSCVLVLVAGSTVAAPAADPAADARFNAARELLEQHVEARRIAGAVAVVRERGRTVFREAIGWQELAGRRPMQTDTMFRIASMTKPITSAAVMMLVEEGRVKLDDPLEKYVPEFAEPRVRHRGRDGAVELRPAERSITIHDLLTHTSGLVYGFSGPPQWGRRYAEAGICEGLSESPLSLAENTRRLARVPLVGQPGSGWQYGLSTDVLGRVVEVASGRPFEAFVRDRILRPLKMNDTHFVVPPRKLSRLATLYRPDAQQRVEAVPAGVHQAGNVRFSATFQHPERSAYRSGGAGLVSTAEDYMRFLSMLLGEGQLDGVRILSADTVRQMTSNQIGDWNIAFRVHGDKFGYGFGVHSPDSTALNGASPGTYSWGGIFHTYFWVDPKRVTAGVLMTQLYPFSHLSLWADFQQHTYDALDTHRDAGRAPGPAPGDVYREFAVHLGGNRNWRVTDPRATAQGAWKFLPNPQLELQLADLEHAVRAEAVLDRWGGHLKTTGKQIRFNGNAWLRVPELETTPPGRAEYYYAQDNPVIHVPLEHLQNGQNTFQGTCTTRDGYGWGQWGLYTLVVRLYDDPARHSAGRVRITSPVSGGTLEEHPRIQVQASSEIEQVQVLAFYRGDDEDGDGRFRDWHGALHARRRGAAAELSGHVGTDRAAPFEVKWDTTWVPDQERGSIRLVARARNRDGRWTVSPIVENLTLRREGTRVVMIRSLDVPESFGVRAERTASCTLDVPATIPLDSIRAARLSLRTWHGWDGHHERLQWNDHLFPIEGNNHHYDFDRLALPATALRHGANRFQIRSNTDHHMLEVLWPGPVLLIRHETSP